MGVGENPTFFGIRIENEGWNRGRVYREMRRVRKKEIFLVRGLRMDAINDVYNQLLEKREDSNFLSTGSKLLDKEINGYPQGGISEVYGKPQSGKTSMLLATASVNSGVLFISLGAALKREVIAYYRLETMPSMRAKVSEELFATLRWVIPQYDMILIDDIDLAVTRTSLTWKASRGSTARFNSIALPEVAKLAKLHKTAIVVTSSIAKKGFIAAGNSLKLEAGTRIKLEVGEKTLANPIKTICGWRRPVIANFKNGVFDFGADMLDFLLEEGKVEKRGSNYYLKGSRIGNSRKEASAFFWYKEDKGK